MCLLEAKAVIVTASVMLYRRSVLPQHVQGPFVLLCVQRPGQTDNTCSESAVLSAKDLGVLVL